MEIQQEVRPDHLRIVVDGPFEVERARIALGEVLREIQSRGLSRLLVDLRGVATRISIADRYDLAAQLAENGPAGLRVAVVAAPGNMFTKTFEDTASNRGASVVTTGSMSDALAFLGLPREP